MSDAVHAEHPDVHTHGLADGCPRCDEHAVNPWDLDEPMLRALVALALDPARLSKLRSDNEGVATAKVLTAMEKFGRIAEVNTPAALGYLARWGVVV